jgi:hypothetical protein
MARAIIRSSFSNETSGTSVGAIAKVLQDAGFKKQGRTACWEAVGVQSVLIWAALDQVMEICRLPREPQGRLDHLWVYIDDPDSEPAADTDPEPESN